MPLPPRLSMTAHGLAVGLLASALVLAAPARAGSITGSASMRERIALPPDAVFEAVLIDIAIADAPARELGRVRLEPAGQPPFRFTIPYRDSDLNSRGRYAVRATVRQGERLLFTTDTITPVLEGGPQAGPQPPVTLQLVQVGSHRQLAGMFRYLADAASIRLCATGSTLPVAMEGDVLRLEKAYLAAQPAESRGEPMLVKLEGLITRRPSAEPGRGPVRTLVQTTGTGVVAQALPEQQHVMLLGCGQGLKSGKGGHPAPPVGQHHLQAGLLQHHLGHPGTQNTQGFTRSGTAAVRPELPGNPLTAMAFPPAQERCAQIRGSLQQRGKRLGTLAITGLTHRPPRPPGSSDGKSALHPWKAGAPWQQERPTLSLRRSRDSRQRSPPERGASGLRVCAPVTLHVFWYTIDTRTSRMRATSAFNFPVNLPVNCSAMSATNKRSAMSPFKSSEFSTTKQCQP